MSERAYFVEHVSKGGGDAYFVGRAEAGLFVYSASEELANRIADLLEANVTWPWTEKQAEDYVIEISEIDPAARMRVWGQVHPAAYAAAVIGLSRVMENAEQLFGELGEDKDD